MGDILGPALKALLLSRKNIYYDLVGDTADIKTVTGLINSAEESSK